MCGSYADEKATDTSVGGICAVALRGAAHAAAAFLQAPHKDTGKLNQQRSL